MRNKYLLISVSLDVIFVRVTVGGKGDAQCVEFSFMLVLSDMSNGSRGETAKKGKEFLNKAQRIWHSV